MTVIGMITRSMLCDCCMFQYTALHLAAGYGHAAVVQVLLQSKADPSHKAQGMTPLEVAQWQLSEGGCPGTSVEGLRKTVAQLSVQKELKSFDSNQDGVIDIHEFTEAYADLPSAAEDFQRWDLDKDGKLSEDELINRAANQTQRLQ